MDGKTIVSIITRCVFIHITFIIAVVISAMYFNSAKILMWFLLIPFLGGIVRTSPTPPTKGDSDGE